jgi:hypothetical protein
MFDMNDSSMDEESRKAVLEGRSNSHFDRELVKAAKSQTKA